MKMSICLEKLLLWVNMLPCQIVVDKVPCGQSACGMWIEFASGKVLVGKVPGFISFVWGYHFACKIKIL